MDLPPITELLPFLSERGKVELDLALAHWQISKLLTEVDRLKESQDETPSR